ncbi:hypothetical protein WICMUC_003624 [Wickerhamomyces mucosus]|uniref:Rab-GAP TBC domain-containing protein n=1 Tax=Wickerhamomyces mucosus TaxID=1378264 RepID=A0A9P8TBL6_9ASCO|nr:hypothetical protein WICMUC_003624 [Wickerhamomyces mucosus]
MSKSTQLDHHPKTLSSLETNMENISLNENDYKSTSVKRLNKSLSSPSFQTSTKGLGITVPKRPSESVFSRLKTNPHLTILERPVSNDSISSTSVSEFSDGLDSRTSSITSGSIDDSSIINNSLSSIDVKSALASHSTILKSITPNNSISNLSVNTLTPSQKYRLRRQNSKNSSTSRLKIKEREKFYEETMNDDDLDDDETFEDGLIWNVPFTKGSAKIFSPASGKSSAFISKIFDESPISMTMSPLRGTTEPSTPSKFYSNPDEANSISKFYQASSNSYFEKQMKDRKTSSISLPNFIKEASEQGYEDSILVSEEKIKRLSSTRPIWLPPKSSDDIKKHEKDVAKILEKSVKFNKQLQQQQDLITEKTIKYNKKWKNLKDRGCTKNINESKKLVFKSMIPAELRYDVWNEFLNDDKYESFKNLSSKKSQIPELPISKLQEIDDLVEKYHDKATGDQLSFLKESLKLKLISKDGLNETDDVLLFIIISLGFSLEDSFNLTQKFQSKVFNDYNISQFETHYKSSAVKKFIGGENFSKDYKSLSYNQLFKILENFSIHSNTNTLLHVLDSLVVFQGSYKIVYSTIIAVLKDYDYGFIALNQLGENNQRLYVTDETNKFLQNVHRYYKNF